MPEVCWYQDDTSVEQNPYYKITYDRKTGLCKLRIPETFVDDSGLFKCVATNDSGRATTMAMLTVTEPSEDGYTSSETQTDGVRVSQQYLNVRPIIEEPDSDVEGKVIKIPVEHIKVTRLAPDAQGPFVEEPESDVEGMTKHEVPKRSSKEIVIRHPGRSLVVELTNTATTLETWAPGSHSVQELFEKKEQMEKHEIITTTKKTALQGPPVDHGVTMVIQPKTEHVTVLVKPDTQLRIPRKPYKKMSHAEVQTDSEYEEPEEEKGLPFEVRLPSEESEVLLQPCPEVQNVEVSEVTQEVVLEEVEAVEAREDEIRPTRVVKKTTMPLTDPLPIMEVSPRPVTHSLMTVTPPLDEIPASFEDKHEEVKYVEKRDVLVTMTSSGPEMYHYPSGYLQVVEGQGVTQAPDVGAPAAVTKEVVRKTRRVRRQNMGQQALLAPEEHGEVTSEPMDVKVTDITQGQITKVETGGEPTLDRTGSVDSEASTPETVILREPPLRSKFQVSEEPISEVVAPSEAINIPVQHPSPTQHFQVPQTIERKTDRVEQKVTRDQLTQDGYNAYSETMVVQVPGKKPREVQVEFALPVRETRPKVIPIVHSPASARKALAPTYQTVYKSDTEEVFTDEETVVRRSSTTHEQRVPVSHTETMVVSVPGKPQTRTVVTYVRPPREVRHIPITFTQKTTQEQLQTDMTQISSEKRESVSSTTTSHSESMVIGPPVGGEPSQQVVTHKKAKEKSTRLIPVQVPPETRMETTEKKHLTFDQTDMSLEKRESVTSSTESHSERRVINVDGPKRVTEIVQVDMPRAVKTEMTSTKPHPAKTATFEDKTLVRSHKIESWSDTEEVFTETEDEEISIVRRSSKTFERKKRPCKPSQTLVVKVPGKLVPQEDQPRAKHAKLTIIPVITDEKKTVSEHKKQQTETESRTERREISVEHIKESETRPELQESSDVMTKTTTSMTDDVTKKREQVELTVIKDETLDYEPPKFSRPIQPQVATEGEDCLFSGVVTGKPMPELTWYRYNTQLEATPQLSMKYDTQTGYCELSLRSVVAGDAANYRCEARNSMGKASCTANLVVVRK